MDKLDPVALLYATKLASGVPDDAAQDFTQTGGGD